MSQRDLYPKEAMSSLQFSEEEASDAASVNEEPDEVHYEDKMTDSDGEDEAPSSRKRLKNNLIFSLLQLCFCVQESHG